MAASFETPVIGTMSSQLTQSADIEPCHFPCFDSEDGAKRLLSLYVELEMAQKLQKQFEACPDAFSGVLRTAWALVLGCYTGLEDICYGYHESWSHRMGGGTSNTQKDKFGLSLMQMKLNGMVSLAELVKADHATRKCQQAGFKGERPPFDTVMFISRPGSMQPSSHTAVLAEDTRHKIRLHVGSSDHGLTILFEWWSSAMSTNQAMNVASTFDQILTEIIIRDETKVTDLVYFSKRNWTQVEAFNHNDLEHVEKCVHEVVQEQVLLRPDAEAVCAWDGSFTYREISMLASRLAHHLISLGVGPEDFVPLCFDKSKWMVVSILGILKAGAAFVPLDPSHPVPRLQALAQKVGAKVMVCSRHHVDMLALITDVIIPVDGETIDQLPVHLAEPASGVLSHNQAYMIFTSGTTGEPKGALIEHRAILSSARVHAPGMLMNSETRALQFAASTFDVSITEILTTLTIGGCVCVPSEEARLNNITGAMNEMRVNWALLTPTFVKFIDPADVPGFKTLCTGGEAMTQAIIRTWSHIDLVNCYGPAETSVVSHVNQNMMEGKNPLNIGHQLGIHCWIVDRHNHDRLMPVGCVGELVIEGHTLAREYYKEKEKTAEAFITDPLWSLHQSTGRRRRRMYKTGDLVRYNADGTLHIAGRKDTQIKFHGQRIELGEIEHHINSDRNVKHGLVLLPKAGYCQGRLLTVLQLSDAQNHDLVLNGRPFQLLEGALKEIADGHVVGTKKFLSGRLPAYMVPSMWLVFEFIPRLPSGKLDRKTVVRWVENMREDVYRRLNPVVKSSSVSMTNATETEKNLRNAFAHVLNLHLDQVGLQQSFLNLGGDSISAMQLMGRCRSKGIGLTVAEILRSKSITHLALLAKAIKTPSNHDEVFEQPFDLSPIQRLYFSRPNHAQGHYNQSFLLRTSQRIEEGALRQAVETVIKRYSMLRARFSKTGANNEWQQRVTNEVSSSYRMRSFEVESRGQVDSKIADSQTCLNPTTGPMFAADLIDVNGDEQLLFMVGHHLIMDLVSWRVILEDVEELILNPNSPLVFEKPLPYQTWCKLQAEHCQDLVPSQVLPIENVPAGNSNYWSMTDQPHTYGEMACEGFEMDPTITALLLSKCHLALRTEIPDILISALIHSFCEVFTDRGVPPVFAEGHGREVWDPAIDISRTVGWFTTMYPVYVPATASENLVNVVRLVKDLRRKVPAKGRPYFASRWITPQGEDSFGRHWPLELTFNYLGQYQQLEREGALLTPAKGIAGEVRAAGDAADVGYDTPCISFFEISAVILQGVLRFSFTFNRHMKHQGSIRKWISSCQHTLRTAVEDLTQMHPEPTLSDFPLLSLTYDSLDTMKTERLRQAGVPSIDLVEDAYPCSPIQQGLLVSTTKDSAFYAAYTLHEVKLSAERLVDSRRLAVAWQTVVNRHPMLRTIFIESVSQQDALFDQIVLKKVDADLVYQQRDSDANAIRSLSEQQAPDYDDGKVLHRFIICTSASGKVFCRLEISHVIMDGTSLSILFRDLALAYEGKLSAGPGPLYSSYIAYLQTLPPAPGIDYWKSYLADVEPCHFPVLNDGNSATKQLKYVRVNFSELPELQKFCDAQGVTFSNAIHTAWALTLRCYTNSEEICFGYITSARDAPIEGAQDAVGPFINMLVCRVNMTETAHLTEIMSKIQQDYLDSLPYRHTPLAEVQHALPLSNTALFNTALSYRKLPPIIGTEEPPVSFIECAPTYDPDEYNVSVNIEAGEKDMAIDLAYWTDCLSDEQAANVASTFTQSLRNILRDSEQVIGRLDHLSERNRQQIGQWNGQIPEMLNDCIHDTVKEQTRIRPDAPAICSWDANFSYAELDETTTKLAHHLVELGVKPETFVLICFDKSAFTIVAMLAVLKAGGACVPLDPAHPQSALELRASDTKAQLVLASAKCANIFEEFIPQIVTVDAKLLAQLPSTKGDLKTTVQPHNACFIIYTSGSTGKPKGVVLEHRSITASAMAHGPVLGYEPDTRVLQFASYTFDNSIAEMFTTLMRGGCVCVPSDYDRLNHLAEVIDRLQVSLIDVTPTVATFLNPAEVPTLKRVVLGGEAITKRVVEIWSGHVTLLCAYGPSECSINSTYSEDISKPGKATNIGRAVGSVSWVVDPSNHDRLSPVGCIGELLIEGPILARCYLNDPEKTAKSFIENPRWVTGATGHTGAKRRMYKTGDLVRYDSDGTLMYLGRKDTQVKLNGQRIELGEIEHHLEQNLPSDVQSAVELVSVGGGQKNKKALAAFVCLQSDSAVPDASETETVMPMSDSFRATAKALEIALGGAMPAYMVPSVWLPIIRIPLTSSGKLNRRRLRTIAQSIPGDQTATYRLAGKSGRAPSTEMEMKLAKIWESILNLEDNAVGAEDSFFKLGGDSIGAMRLVTIARSMGILLTVASIFQRSNLSEMAIAASGVSNVVQVELEPFSLLKIVESVSQLKQEVATQCRIDAQSIQNIYPCTSMQEGLMALSIREPGAYVAQMIYHLPMDMDINRFRAAWDMVVKLEQALRTRIIYTKDRGFLQVVVHEPISWGSSIELQNVCESERLLPSYDGDVLTRYTIAGENTASCHFVWTIHHALYDGWCLSIILEKVKACYDSLQNPQLTSGPSYATFIKHLTEIDAEESDKFWRSKLSEITSLQFPRLPNPGYQARASGMLTHVASISRPVGSEITAASTIRAAWALVVAAYSGSDDVVFCETVTGRDAPVPGVADMIGPTLTTIPTRLCIDREHSIAQFLKDVQTQSAEAMPYQYAGLQYIKRLSSDAAIACEAQNLIAINSGSKQSSDDFWNMQNDNEMAGTNFYTYPLMLSCYVGSTDVEIDAHYDKDIIPTWQMERLLHHFEFILERLSSRRGDHQTLGEMEIVGPKDQETISSWNSEPLQVVDRCVHHLIQERALAMEVTKPAVCSWDASSTYRELDNLATQLASYLVAIGVGHETIVPLCFEKSAWTVVAMLAVLKSGGAFVPLDPAHPEARLQDIVDDVAAKIVLCSPKYSKLCKTIASQAIAIDRHMISQVSARGAALPDCTTNSAAYIIFTSGTTGKPKGTIVEHAAFSTSATAHGSVMQMQSSSRVLQFASYTFDASVMEILSTLIFGGCVCIPNNESRMNNITDVINEMDVNWALLTPSFVQLIQPSAVPRLGTLVLGGEAMSQGHILTWSNNVHLMNAYGPSETAIIATVNPQVTLEAGPGNMGRAVGGRCWIADAQDHNRLVPIGSVGELLVEGPILARGYLNNPQKTAESFITDPKWAKLSGFGAPHSRRMYKTGDLVKYTADSTMIFLGRKDNQVKLHGQRMELGEVEHHLATDSVVKHALAAIPISGRCQKRLVAVLSLHGLAKSNIPSKDLLMVDRYIAKPHLSGIRERISSHLPAYMVPSKWLILHELPLMPSGKLDRRQIVKWVEEMSDENFDQISEVETITDTLDRETTHTEQQLQSIWGHVLNIPAGKVALNKSFLHLGGDSMSAMQVMARCRSEKLGVTVQAIIRSNSIVQLALQVTLPEEISYEAEEIEKNFDLSPIQQLYFECVGDNWAQFNQSVFLHLRHPATVTELTRALEAIVSSHSMLRARYSKSEAGVWQQRITQDVQKSYRLRVHKSGTTTDQVSSLIEESQKDLDIENGPLFAVDLFAAQGNDRQLVSFAAHHLVIDVVSWRIVMQDLEDFLTTGALKAQSSLSFQSWCRLQAEQAKQAVAKRVIQNNDVPLADLGYWGMDGEANVHGDILNESFELDAKTTTLLLSNCHEALNTDPVDIFMAAIMESFRREFPDRTSIPAIYNEGHGREPWDPKLDLSQTIGWFTTICPVYLPNLALGDENLVDVIRWVKDFRRRIPEKGRPYFAHRILTEEGRESFADHWPMEIMFNYLGQTQQANQKDELLQIVDEFSSDGANTKYDIGPNVPRFALFEISAAVTNGTAKFTFSYNRHMKRQAAILNWIAGCQNMLQEAVERLTQMRREPTMSDFPLLPLAYNGLANLVEILPQTGVSSIEELEDAYPCSAVQQGILFTQIRDSQYYSYRANFEVKSTSQSKSIDINQFAAAWQAVIQRHSTLRTVFVESISQDGMMDQVVLKNVVGRIEWLDCDDSEVLSVLAQQPSIDCTESQAPHRLTICQTNLGRVFCMIEMSHAICDGTSIPILFRDLALAYEGKVFGSETAPLYSDYIAHMQQTSQVKDKEYWKSYLTDIKPCYFPTLNDGKKDIKDLRSLGQKLTHASELQSFCTRNGVTLSNVLQLVWALVLQSYTGSSNVCFGYLTAGRDIPVRGIQDAIGVFINMLTCRVNLDENLQLSHVLKQIQTDFIGGLDHQHVSLADVQHELQLSGTSLFNTAYSFQKRTVSKDMSSSSLSFDIFEANDPSEYDITVNVEVWDSSAEVEFCYWTDKLSEAQASNMASTFDHILSNLIHHHDDGQTIGELDLLSDHCRQQIVGWNTTLPHKINRCIHEIFEQHVRTRPSHTPAVCAWDVNFTYKELDGLSSRLADRLTILGVGPESYVPLCFEKSAWTIVAMLGVLKAGGAFVPLDPSHPETRLEYLVESVKAKIVLCSPQYEKKFSAAATKTFIVSSKKVRQLPAKSSTSPAVAVTPDNAAYIIFTSGTTGLPKGTIIEHAAFSTGATAHGKAMSMYPTSRVLQFASHTFDASIMEILTTLIIGGCICVPSDQERLNDIPTAIKRMAVTWTLLTPSIASILKPRSVPSLKVLVTGGEAMSEGHIQKWAGRMCLVNAYGPSECSVVATTSTKVNEYGNETSGEPANIGHAVGSRSWVVDSKNHNRLMPVGSIGELVVEGRIVARGYLNNKQKTEDAFISNPTWMQDDKLRIDGRQQERMYKTGDLVRYDSDGSLNYIGRKDTQIKLNGQRIELGEIEHHVKVNLPEETQSAVDLVSPESRIATKTLAVFYSAAADASVSSQDDDISAASPISDQSTVDELLLPMSNHTRSLAKALETALKSAVPAYMVPTLYIPVTKMPWTTSGKLDRTRLKNMVQKLAQEDVVLYKLASTAVAKRAPATEMEKRLQRSWETVLRLNAGSIGADDSFFRVGGDSITAMQLVAAARLERISLTVLIILRHPKLSDMAKTCISLEHVIAVETKPFALFKDISSIGPLMEELAEQCRVSIELVRDAYPCSSLQEGLITLSTKQSGAYIAQNVFQIPSTVDIARFKAAWQKTIEDVDILRTRIVLTKASQFVQVVLESQPMVWCSANTLEETKERAMQLPQHNGGPLTQYTIVYNAELRTHYFVWSIHHALYDGWSMPLIMKRVENHYFDGKSIAPRSPYVNFIKYLSEADVQASDEFWKSRFLEASPMQFPPPRSSASDQGSSSGMQTYTTSISRNSIALDVTVPTIIRAAWAMVVATYSGSDDVVFGEVLSGRDVPVLSITDIMGPTLTTVPTRVQVDRTSIVSRFLQKIHQQAIDAIPFQHSGLQHIKRLSPDIALAADFQNLLVIQTGDEKTQERLWHPLDTGVATNFFTYPLVLECTVGETKLTTIAHHDENVIPSWEVQKILSQFDSVVKQLGFASKSNSKKICEIEICSPEDTKIIREWNSHKLGLVDHCVHELFLQQALSQPDAPAICAWDGEFTYHQVKQLASHLACYLQQKGVGPEVLVPICVDKSAWSVITMFAILLAGGACVPIDPTHPISRHAEIVLDIKATVLVCSPQYANRYREMLNTVVPISETLMRDLSTSNGNDPLSSKATTRNAAIVVYTSGSTGQPKGVLIEHQAFCTSSAAFRRAMFVKSNSRVFNFASHTFDAGIMEVLSTLICGACVCVPAEDTKISNITESINSMNVTWTFLTPSVANIVDTTAVPSLEVLVCGGEALSIETVNKWADKVKLINGYGPTECTVFAVVNANVSEDKDASCIGRAHHGGYTWIVDPNNHDSLSPVGCVGELLLEGPLLARGYINDAEKTAKSFIENPTWTKSLTDGKPVKRRMYKTGDLVKYSQDGSIIYIGRKDNQVKLHGQRMELGEIEHRLGTDSRVRHAVVVLPKSGLCKNRLVGVVSLSDLAHEPVGNASVLALIDKARMAEAQPHIAKIEETISSQLPPYMIPTTWLTLNAIPLLPSGKLNKKKIAAWVEDMDEETYGRAMGVDKDDVIDVPDTTTGNLLRQTWSHVLKIPLEEVSGSRSFLALGGDSITAMQVMAKCREANLNLSLHEVLRSKSITQLSEMIDSQDRLNKHQMINHVEKIEEVFDLAPIQQLFFENSIDQNRGDQFNQSFLLRITKATKAEDLERAIELIVNQHSMLRARFSKTKSGVWQQRITQDTRSSYTCRKHQINRLNDMTPAIAHSQKSLDIRTGPLFAVDHFDVKGDGQIISLIGHHLVIDMVSWLSIMRDLETVLAVGKLTMGRPLSFQSWCAAQAENAKQTSGQHDNILPFKTMPANLAYWGIANRRNIYGDVVDESFTADNSITVAALIDCHKALRTEPIDLFLSVLAHSFGRVFVDREMPTIFNEGHGREPWDHSIDLSSTVGWFTTVCPVHVSVDREKNDVVETMRRMKDVRRKVPNNGRPYFARRYLTEDGKAECKGHMPMEICFNYLGKMKQVGNEDSLLKNVDYDKTEEEAKMTADVGPNTSRLALFEISAAVLEEGIQFTFMYNKNIQPQRQQQIRRWIVECQRVLQESVRRLANISPEPTLSDFPLLPINYDGLRKLVAKALPAANVSSFNDVEEIYPCSPMQEGLLLSQLKEAGRYLFHTILEVKPKAGEGKVNAQRLLQAWQKVVNRHAALRTLFIDSVYPGGTFDQIVVKQADSKAIMLRCKEFEMISKMDAITMMEGPRDKQIKLPHQLTVCETPEGKVFLKLEMNHAVMDGVSTSILVRDLARAYAGQLPAGQGPLYSNYIQFIGREAPTVGVNFWKSYLEKARPCQFPTLNDESTKNHLGSISLKFDRFSELQALCKQSKVTLSNVMLAAWALILRSYTKSNDVCFGYLASGRDAPIDGIQDTMGVFINMLVYRFEISPAMSLDSLFQKAQDDYLQSLPHQHSSLGRVQHELNMPREGLFNTAVSIQNSSGSDESNKDPLTFESITAHDPSEYAVTLNINTAHNDEGVVIRYWSNTLSDIQAEKLASNMADLLTNIVDKPQQTISQLSLFSSDNNVPAKSLLEPGMLRSIIRECTHEILEQLFEEGILVRYDNKPEKKFGILGQQTVAIAANLQPDDVSSEQGTDQTRQTKAVSFVEEPSSFVEKKLMLLWSEFLGLEEREIGNDESFFQLGGDSIKAMAMVGSAREEGLSMTVADVFRSPSFGDMVKAIHVEEVESEPEPQTMSESLVLSDLSLATTCRTSQDDSYENFSLLEIANVDKFLQDYVCPIVHVFRGGIVDVLPVTDFQSLAITGTLLESRWMLNYFFLDGRGPLDLRRLKQSAFQLVQAFDVLRTVFIPHGDRYLQVVLRQLQPEFLVYEIEQDLGDFATALHQNSLQHCPRLGEPYVQFTVAKQKNTDRHRIFLRISHAQYDGVCFPAILEALQAGYQGETILPTPSFSAFVAKSAGKATSDFYHHWQTLLKGSTMTDIVHRERPNYNRSEGATRVLKQTIRVASLASMNITPATIIKAAWALVLARMSAQPDVVFGHVISGRNIAVRGIESMVGPCVNIVPVRIKFQSTWTVLDLLKLIQDQQMTNMPFESLGFREIIKQCTDWPDWTNFSTVVQHQSMAQSTKLRIGENEYSVGAVASQEDFADFTVVSIPQDADNVEINLIFAPNGAITPEFAEQVLNVLCHTITSFSQNPRGPLPSPADFIGMQSQTLEDIIRSTDAPALTTVLHGLSKKELYILSDNLGRAWRQILRNKQGKAISIPPNSSFFNLGGDIIGLAQVATLLEREGYKVRLEDLIDNPIMSDQMALLSLQSFQGKFQEIAQDVSPVVRPREEVVVQKRGTLWRKMVGLRKGKKGDKGLKEI